MIRTRDRQLREDLKALGEHLASPVPLEDGADDLAAISEDRRTGRRRLFAFGLAGAAAVALIVAVSVRDEPNESQPPAGGVSLTDAEVVACSDGIGYGRITAVSEPDDKDQVRMSLAIDEWLKPPPGAENSITFKTMSAAFKSDPPYRTGDRVLVILQEAVSNHLVYPELADPTNRASAQAMGKDIANILAQAEPVTCPAFWGRPDNGSRG